MLSPKPWRRPMVARDHAEPHRQASWLELLFDLSFVVAVAQAAVALEHALAAGHTVEGIVGYLIVFAAIWWAWMAFTWFANVFDTDDVPYRLLMFLMIAGSLGLAAGVPRMFELDFRIGVVSYVVMRLAYVGQWFRVYRSHDPSWQRVALRIIMLVTIIQLGWIASLSVPEDWKLLVFCLLFAVELATPYIAGWDARAGGHRNHIVERYGLFTIIVLGEAIAAATVAVGHAIDAENAVAPLLVLGLGGLVAACSVWWIYFDFSTGLAPTRSRAAQYFWGYMHFFVFAALAALGAGLTLAVAKMTDPAHVALADWAVAMVAGGAVAVFLLTITLIEWFAESGFEPRHLLVKIGGAALAVSAAFGAQTLSIPGSVLVIGMISAALVAYGVNAQHRLHVRSAQ
jgi:low temperature requirement protein LtrA